MLENYGSAGPTSIARTLNRSVNSVEQKAKRLYLKGGQSRKHAAIQRCQNSSHVNAKYFDEIDPGVAYTLGFTFSCGSLKTKYRTVLRLRSEQDRCRVLKNVLSEMQSQHVLQPSGSYWVVEICNSYLVGRLIKNWGVLPSRKRPDPPMPKIPASLMRQFIIGHLAGSGWITSTIVRWTGSTSVVEAIGKFLSCQLGSKEPFTQKSGATSHVCWRDPGTIGEIREFLGLNGKL